MASLHAEAIPTRIFTLGEDLFNFIVEHVPHPKDADREGRVLAVTSKIVSLAERAVIARSEVSSKMDLVKREADQFICEAGHGTALTIKHGLLIPAAGIDESNAQDEFYILFPRNPYKSANELCARLRKHYGVEKLGLIITDSHTQPLRRGVTGIGLAHAGFKAVRDMRGESDLFGRQLHMTSVNLLDAFSVAAVLVMGEARESCPLAWVDASGVEFTNERSSAAELQVSLADDLYGPLFK